MRLSGVPEKWNYQVGVYSTGSDDRGFGEFNGSLFALMVVGYDLGESLGFDKALLAVKH